MNKGIIVLLIGIILISGCVGGENLFKGLMGGKQEVKEQTPDIIVTQNLNVIPNPPITAGNEFSVTFDVKNQDEVKSIKDTYVKLYDWGACSAIELSPDSTEWKYENGTYSRKFEELVPQQEERIEFKFIAPTNERIGSIETDCPIKWFIEYKYSSISQDDFTVISQSHLKELQRSGQSWAGIDNPMYVGGGPVKIYFDWKTPMPVQSNGSVQFSVRVEDKGTGGYTEVAPGTLFIKVPDTWTYGVSGCSPAEKFIRSTEGEFGEFAVYKNTKPIPLIKKSSAELICRFKAPDLDHPALSVPERTYSVSANITDYSYKLMEETSVHIKPSV